MGPEIEQVLPKYLQVADHIRGQIVRGELAPGDEVPSEREIAEQWNVSRPTATRALAALRAEGLVEARQGSGTFVRRAREDPPPEAGEGVRVAWVHSGGSVQLDVRVPREGGESALGPWAVT